MTQSQESVFSDGGEKEVHGVGEGASSWLSMSWHVFIRMIFCSNERVGIPMDAFLLTGLFFNPLCVVHVQYFSLGFEREVVSQPR